MPNSGQTTSVAMLLRYYDDIPKDVVDKDEREGAIQLRNLVRKAL